MISNSFDREHYNPKALAAVRQGAREGTLLDVANDPIFIGLMLRNLREKLDVDESDASRQSYVQDCPVCCQPWQVEVTRDRDGDWSALVRTSDE